LVFFDVENNSNRSLTFPEAENRGLIVERSYRDAWEYVGITSIDAVRRDVLQRLGLHQHVYQVTAK
jgi:hypothetical protein